MTTAAREAEFARAARAAARLAATLGWSPDAFWAATPAELRTALGLDVPADAPAAAADTSGFARDIADIRGQLDGPLASGAERAGRTIETALAKAIRTGSVGFDDLRKVALSALAEIAASAIKTDLTSIFGGGTSGGGLLGSLASAASSLFGGAPGRATGGPVTGGQAYVVGERGPELFVPTAAGRIAAGGGATGAINITVNVATPHDAAPAFMQRTGAQVARAVRQALDRADG